MKRQIICMVYMFFLIGCAQKSTEVKDAATATTSGTAQAAPITEPAEPSEIAALRSEAKAMHVHFHIRCNISDTGFDAEAWPDTLDNNPTYIEDGGVPGWIIWGAATQEEAAAKLRKALKRHTNWVPQHKPQNHKDHCPPEIRG